MATQPLPTSSPSITIPASIDYTSRDYMGMMNSLLVFASQAFPDWNPGASEGDFGVIMLELFSYVGDILSYYTDRVAQEAYLPTATQRQSILNIAQLLGYVPSNGTAATGTVTFVTDNPGLAVVIPENTQLQSNYNTALDAPVFFYTTAQVTVPGNGGTAVANVAQGELFSMVAIGTSTGLPGMTLQLPNTGVLDGSVKVYVQSSDPSGSTQWSQVTSFINSGENSTVYTLFNDAKDVTNITFGDGINGLIPGLGLQIYASYTTIVGSAGNQPMGAVNIIVDTIAGVSIQTDAAGIFQSSVMAGGSDEESNDSIRANAPISFATQNRAVSLQDFNNLALGIPGVVSANAVANHSTSVSLYVLGPNATVPSGVLQANILTFFQNNTLAGVTISLPTPNLIAIDVGSVSQPFTLVVKPTASQVATKNAVITALNNFLTPPASTFGQLITIGNIMQVIMNVPGVSWADVDVFTREDVVQVGTTNIQLRESEIAIAGNYFMNVSGGL